MKRKIGGGLRNHFEISLAARTLLSHGVPVLAFLMAGLAWELLARYSGWRSTIFPGPTIVFRSMLDLIRDGTMLQHLVASLFRVTVGFYLAMALGIPLGIVLGRSIWVRQFVNPLVQFLRPISPLAWIPLSMLWFGIGDLPAIFLIFLSSFFPLIVSTAIAVQSINPIYFQVAANFKFNRVERVFHIIVPAIVPSVVTALRMTITIAWMVVVAAEMIAVKSGLGYLILDSRNALRMDYVMDGMIVIGLIGLLLDGMMRWIGKIDSAEWGRFVK